ncbi:MAG: T9SS type A sorting domain-containing protein, partial [Flavobacteriales bacterium]
DNMWVCSEPQKNGGFSIWAFQKEENEITGWKERSAISYDLQQQSLPIHGKSKVDSNFLEMNEEFVEKKLSKMLASIIPQSVERFRDDEAGEFDDDYEATDDQDTLVSERLIHQIYPVPVNSILTLELIDEGEYNAVIYNLKGQQVFEQSFRGDLVEFNLESLENGKHILALLNNAGVVVDQESIYISH